MSYLDQTIQSYLDAVDSPIPAPGGGSVSALTSAVGAALGRMVGHLTVDRKQFRTYDPSIQNDYQTNFELLKQIKKSLMACVDDDVEAFSSLMAAYKLPEKTEAEKKRRNEKIAVATVQALDVPLKTAKLSLKALMLIHEMMPYSNKYALSDIGISALLLKTAIDASIITIQSNLHSLPAVSRSKRYEDEIIQLKQQSKALTDMIMAYVEGVIGKSLP